MNLRTAHPDQPWLWRADWAAGEIHSSPKAKAIGLSLLAIFWNVCALAAVGTVPNITGPDRTKTIAWIMAFPAIGLGILLTAVRALLQWREYGESRFLLKSVPGSIGGALAGEVRCLHPLPPMRAVELRLTCINSARQIDGKIADQPIWSDQAEVSTDADGGIPVAFYIPPECRPTATEPLDNRVTWKLIASFTANPVSYRAKFEVPIFKLNGTLSRPADTVQLRALRDARVKAFETPEQSRIRVTLTDDGSTEIFFPAFRNPGVALWVTAFLVVWSGVTFIIFKYNAPLIFKIVWPLFDMLIGIWTMFLLFGSTAVVIGRGEMTIVSRLIGIPVRRRRLAVSEISEIGTGAGMYAGNTVYRRIQVHRTGKDTLNFGDGIPDSIEAEWIASKITQAIGLENREDQS